MLKNKITQNLKLTLPNTVVFGEQAESTVERKYDIPYLTTGAPNSVKFREGVAEGSQDLTKEGLQ